MAYDFGFCGGGGGGGGLFPRPGSVPQTPFKIIFKTSIFSSKRLRLPRHTRSKCVRDEKKSTSE